LCKERHPVRAEGKLQIVEREVFSVEKNKEGYDVLRERWKRRKLSEEKKVSKAALDKLDEMEDEDFDVSDPKRVPTYERRRYAGTDFKLGKYGYFCVLPADDENDAQIRKITPFQRKCIILYYVEKHDGKPFNIRKMAKDLAVEDRTIQYDLRWLEKKGYLRAESRTDPKKGTVENAYHFKCGIEDEFYDFKPTIRKAYGLPNSLGLREWHWDDYKTIPGVEDEYHNAYDKYEALGELNKKKAAQKKIVHKRRIETFPPMVKENMRKAKKNKTPKSVK
jgi:predicted transcriptional regulator